MFFLMILMIIFIIALTRVVAEFWRPDVDRDEAKPRVFDGVPVFPLHLSQNSGRSVLHHSNYSPFLFLNLTKMQTSEGVSSVPLPPPESLFGPPPPLETTTSGSPGPQDPIGGSSNLLAPVSSSTVSYVNHSHATYYPTDLYSGYPVASVFSAAGAQKTALQPTRQRTKARSNAGNLRPDLLTCYYCTK